MNRRKSVIGEQLTVPKKCSTLPDIKLQKHMSGDIKSMKG